MRKYKLYLLAFILGVGLLAPSFAVDTVNAANLQGKWVDKVSIQLEGKVYKDSNPFDGTHNYKSPVGDNCDSSLDINDFDKSGKTAKFKKKKKNSIGECLDDGKEQTVDLSNEGSRKITAYKISNDTIFLPVFFTIEGGIQDTHFFNSDVYGINGHFRNLPKDASTYSADKFPFYNTSTTEWDNYDGAGGAQVYLKDKKLRSQSCFRFSCHLELEADLNFANNADITQPDETLYPSTAKKTTTPGQPGGVNNISGDSRPSCENTGDSPLSWIICPLINGAAIVADYILDKFIKPGLDNVPISSDPDEPLYKAWSGFRIIANIMLIGALLAVVYAQITGKE